MLSFVPDGAAAAAAVAAATTVAAPVDPFAPEPLDAFEAATLATTFKPTARLPEHAPQSWVTWAPLALSTSRLYALTQSTHLRSSGERYSDPDETITASLYWLPFQPYCADTHAHDPRQHRLNARSARLLLETEYATDSSGPLNRCMRFVAPPVPPAPAAATATASTAVDAKTSAAGNSGGGAASPSASAIRTVAASPSPAAGAAAATGATPSVSAAAVTVVDTNDSSASPSTGRAFDFARSASAAAAIGGAGGRVPLPLEYVEVGPRFGRGIRLQLPRPHWTAQRATMAQRCVQLVLPPHLLVGADGAGDGVLPPELCDVVWRYAFPHLLNSAFVVLPKAEVAAFK